MTDEQAQPGGAGSRETIEERYRLIVEGARDYAILTMDLEGRIDSWSAGATASYGWTAEEAIGQESQMLFVPEDRARGEPAWELDTAREHGVAPDIRWHQRKDGRQVFIEGSTRALRGPDGEISGFLKVGQDVTRRRETEQALRASETRYRTLVDNIRDYAIYLLDADGIVTEWTPGAERVTGYTAAEAIGRHLAQFFPPEAVASGEPEQELAEAAATGRTERIGWRMRKDGSRFWANEIATAVHDVDGTLVGFTKVTRDLTEQRMSDEASQRAKGEQEREAMRRQLAAAEEAERRRLARELHDQLGQHLTGFTLGLTETRRRVAAGESVEVLLTRLEELANAMTRDARYLALELRPPELDDVGLESALETYVRQWGERYGVAAEVAINGWSTGAVPTEIESALYRITQEALTNVAKHAAATQVSVIIEQRDGEVTLVVEDDGSGFEVQSTMRRARDEQRLGMDSMRERAALMGGTLVVESNPGGGTTLYIRVPLPDAQPNGAPGTDRTPDRAR